MSDKEYVNIKVDDKNLIQVIIIVLVVLILYTYLVFWIKINYDFSCDINGMWSADIAFCKAAELDMAGAYIHDGTIYLFMVVDNEPIVNCISKYSINGWMYGFSKRHTFDLTIKDLPEDAPFSKKLKMEYNDNKIRLYKGEDTFLIMYKNQSLSEI